MMKTKILKITVVVLVFIGSFASCEKPNTTNGETAQLQGTKWKLTGIVDVETGTLQELEPKDCEKCYMLKFEADSSFYSNSATNAIWGSYKAEYETGNIFIHCGLMTEVGAIGDENLYVETLNIIQSFYLQNKELRLYYNNKKNYLQFKSQQP